MIKSVKKTTKDTPLKMYSYPTIGDGITIEAVDKDEADQKAKEILESLSK